VIAINVASVWATVIRYVAWIIVVVLYVSRSTFSQSSLTAAASQDDQCKGNLICFKRGPNDSVPGCIGHDPTGKCMQSQPLFLHIVVYFQVAHACTLFHHIQALTIVSGQIRLRRCLVESLSFAKRWLVEVPLRLPLHSAAHRVLSRLCKVRTLC
jgi:hypothetical protein